MSEEPQITFHKCLQFLLYNYIWNRIISTLWKNDNQVACKKWWITASLSGGFSSQVKNLSQKVYSKFYRVWIWIVWQDGLSIQSLNPFEFGVKSLMYCIHTLCRNIPLQYDRKKSVWCDREEKYAVIRQRALDRSVLVYCTYAVKVIVLRYKDISLGPPCWLSVHHANSIESQSYWGPGSFRTLWIKVFLL